MNNTIFSLALTVICGLTMVTAGCSNSSVEKSGEPENAALVDHAPMTATDFPSSSALPPKVAATDEPGASKP